jgi:catechol 1,2-dioxygenase
MTKTATMQGEPTWVTGKVMSVDGKPIAGATIDVWQAKADGIYDIQDPKAESELRGRVKSDAEGRYAFRTFKPKFYGVPVDGPVGDLLRQMERHPMRPAHMHAIVTAPGYRQVITHVFVEGDPYLDSDAVFAVKDSLIAEWQTVDSPAEAKKLGMPNPFLKIEFDLRLAPETGAKARQKISAADAVA